MQGQQAGGCLASTVGKPVRSMSQLHDVASRFGLPLAEVLFIEFNRSGVWTEDPEIPVGYRARFLCDEQFSDKEPMYFAVPVRCPAGSLFSIKADGQLRFDEFEVGPTTELEIDTCDTSYFRRNRTVLNLNSNRRGNCGGCKQCVHNYPIYDGRVLKDQVQLNSDDIISRFLEGVMSSSGWTSLSHLHQVAVVTGLFSDENEALAHLGSVRQVAANYGFHGSIFFLGCEINSAEAVVRLAELAPISFAYAIDCFDDREQRLAPRKGQWSLDSVYATLSLARQQGIETSYAYVAGIDPLPIMAETAERFADACSRHPIVNIYQMQHPSQTELLQEEAESLDYYLEARAIFEGHYASRGLYPNNWENYRSLWYHQCGPYSITE